MTRGSLSLQFHILGSVYAQTSGGSAHNGLVADSSPAGPTTDLPPWSRGNRPAGALVRGLPEPKPEPMTCESPARRPSGGVIGDQRGRLMDGARIRCDVAGGSLPLPPYPVPGHARAAAEAWPRPARESRHARWHLRSRHGPARPRRDGAVPVGRRAMRRFWSPWSACVPTEPSSSRRSRTPPQRIVATRAKLACAAGQRVAELVEEARAARERSRPG